MPQFCILFYANYTIRAAQRGGAWPNAPPLNTLLAKSYISIKTQKPILCQPKEFVYFYQILR